ncbi:hypothetical protein I316_07788 [Kwoniella heveanensis BCC8398]|uniref:Uncharacterized protein n=1 Tax=Kwoniella heveanensis BCC8398 TaxID=1296120 RepID=A0A1B9GHW3_9TREE|nr:hypothetical protein I316_07788 [Kwoniella heveanensis BCC8398]
MKNGLQFADHGESEPEAAVHKEESKPSVRSSSSSSHDQVQPLAAQSKTEVQVKQEKEESGVVESTKRKTRPATPSEPPSTPSSPESACVRPSMTKRSKWIITPVSRTGLQDLPSVARSNHMPEQGGSGNTDRGAVDGVPESLPEDDMQTAIGVNPTIRLPKGEHPIFTVLRGKAMVAEARSAEPAMSQANSELLKSLHEFAEYVRTMRDEMDEEDKILCKRAMAAIISMIKTNEDIHRATEKYCDFVDKAMDSLYDAILESQEGEGDSQEEEDDSQEEEDDSQEADDSQEEEDDSQKEENQA